MKRFAQLFGELDATTSTNDKVASLAVYFSESDPADAAWALFLLMGKKRRRIITSRSLRQFFFAVSDLPEWLFEECYAHVGDSAETIALLLENDATDSVPAKPDLPLHQWLEREIAALAPLDEPTRQERVLAWWRQLDPEHIFILNKIITGGFRVGVSRKLVVRGLAKAHDLEEPVLTHRLMGDWEPSADFYENLIDRQAGAYIPSRPFPFFLASPLEGEPSQLGDPADWLAEWKWDGIRAQVIRREQQTYIWSRGEDLLEGRFPELEKACAVIPDGTVLDGEILAWRDGNPLPFSVLQKRIGRKKLGPKILADAPIHLLVYDLLEHEGRDIRELGLGERRSLLKKIVVPLDGNAVSLSPEVVFTSWEETNDYQSSARERGVEGLMIKRRAAPYRVGRKRGDWWKYKVDPYTLDAVLIYAQAGSGRRSNLFTDYTFALWNDEGKLVPFAKAYSGLDNAEIGKLDRWIRRHTLEKFGPVRSVQAHHVFEIAFEGIQASKRHKSGIAVRFPRIHRWREDKKIDQADSLATARELLP
jgi:DNA ligase-1